MSDRKRVGEGGEDRRETLEMPAAWREHLREEMRKDERESLPPIAIQKEIAEARGRAVEVCPLCKCGLVDAEVAELARSLVEPAPDSTPTGTKLQVVEEPKDARDLDPFQTFDEDEQ